MNEWDALVTMVTLLSVAGAATWLKHHVRNIRYKKEQQESRIDALDNGHNNSDTNTDDDP